MMPALYIRLAGIAIALALVAAAVFALYGYGYNAGQDNVQAKWDVENVERIVKDQAAAAASRAKERGLVYDLQLAQDALAIATAATQAQLDNALSGVRADNLKLRERFRSCTAKLSADPGATGGDDETRDSGLSAADEELALRIGAEADQVVHQLNACQAYVKSVVVVTVGAST